MAETIWTTEDPGSMVPLRPGQWIGGMRGTKEQEVAQFRRYRNAGDNK